jgi:hypothetical protein
MSTFSWPLAILGISIWAQSLTAQHCAPIAESYLSSVRLVRQTDGLSLSLDYTKTGGRQQQSYQAYLLAYPERLSAELNGLTPQQAIEQKLAKIVETRLLTRIEGGRYESQWELKTEPFVEQMATAGLISPDRVNQAGGWKSYQDPIRLAVFIPFLEDETYSNLDGLPRDRHECNYAGEAALLFETLPQALTICFGIVQAVRLEDGAHYLQVNGRRPLGEKAK